MICMSADEFVKEHNIDVDNVSVATLKQFAHICDTGVMAGHNTFVLRSNLDHEKAQLITQLSRCDLILYKHINKPHEKYSYYYVLGFISHDIVNVKKLFKATKLKAFL